MKKIFTLLVAMAAMLSVKAADIELFRGQTDLTPVNDGDVIEVGYTVESFFEGVYNVYTLDPELVVKGKKGLEATVSTHADAYKYLMVCSFDGNCAIPAENVVKTGILGNFNVLKEEGDMVYQHLMIHAEFSDATGAQPQDVITPFSATVSVYPTAAPEEKVTITLNFVAKPASEVGSVANVALDSDFIRLSADNVLNYHVSAPATLQIYAITGNLVARYSIADAGSINLSNLPKGIYVYTDGMRKGKILVK